MGWQHGCQVRALRPLIAEAIDERFKQIDQDQPDEHFETLFHETCQLLREQDPRLLEMVRGQAEALDFDFDLLLRYGLVSYLRDDLTTRKPRAIEGCTSWAATGSAVIGGSPILVKNRDYRLEHSPLQVIINAMPKAGFRYLASGSAGSPGIFSAGINEVGLSVADTHVCSTDLGPGLPDYSLMMHVLETQDSVAAAVDYLRSVPRMGRNNLILADAQGSLAVFEIGHSQYGLFETRDGTLVNTNHFVSPEMKDCFVDVSPTLIRGNTFHRYDKVTAELNAAWGKIDVPFAQRLMATHAGPLASICRHPMEGVGFATMSATVFLPAERTMLFCHGLPCQGTYTTYDLTAARTDKGL